ncbi:phenolic glucoside malonyltransferase 1-like [Lotus japonicus]|uniref:phenolic glucoside malonyltransferase 1-like n=1 Tax=Lotus japonicus TaxID=34305 RepID=UPI00258BF0B8|nr:phenolic glucoside malonyltransferase 1-like [Lotus japonicus]
MAQQMKLHQVCSVAPPPQETSTPSSLPLTFFDIPWLRIPPVVRLFFYEYPNSTSSFFDSVLPKLKHSLSLTLQHFLPLAGNIIWPHDSSKPIINYVPGDAVSFIVAESNADFNHVSSNFCEGEQRHPLISRLNTSHEKASVMAFQVTLFPNSGFSIGITTHHAVLDGKSSMLFIKAWAYACSNLKDQQHSSSVSLPENLTPFFDRSVIKDPSGMGEVYVKGLLNHGGETNNRSLKVMDVIGGGAAREDAVKGLFEFTPSHIQKLKQHAEFKTENNKVHLSSFLVVCAHLLACAVKAEQPKSNRVACVIGIDCRHRLEPPIKPTYVGNCIVPHIVEAETGEVLGDDGFINALLRISDALSSLEGGVVNVAENWISKFQSAMRYKLFSITGSPRFDVYGVDFGWGRPKKVDMPSADRAGSFSLSASRDHDGGVEIGFALNKTQMEAFAQGLKSLD